MNKNKINPLLHSDLNPAKQQRKENIGHMQIFLCFVLWGLLPLYFKLLTSIPAFELLLYRGSLSFLCMLLFILLQKQFAKLISLVKNKKNVLNLAISSTLISTNWGIFIVAVETNRVIETSFGYFVSPLISILLSGVFLHERMTKLQKLATLLVIIAIFMKALKINTFPWISIIIAISFSSYGLFKKKLDLPALPAFTVEMGIFTPPALGLIAYSLYTGTGSVVDQSAQTLFVLTFIGLVTIVPMLLFNSGVKKIKLSTTAFYQYLTPGITFLLSVFLFKEGFTSYDFIAFSLIFISIALANIKTKSKTEIY